MKIKTMKVAGIVTFGFLFSLLLIPGSCSADSIPVKEGWIKVTITEVYNADGEHIGDYVCWWYSDGTFHGKLCIFGEPCEDGLGHISNILI